MLFNSIEYLFFLPIVFLIYWVIGYAKINDSLKLRMQNAFVVIASYVFYGWWNWRFLLLITFTSVWSWISGLHLARIDNIRERKIVVTAALIVNLGILGVFKYYNFFCRERDRAFGNAWLQGAYVNIEYHPSCRHIILHISSVKLCH